MQELFLRLDEGLQTLTRQLYHRVALIHLARFYGREASMDVLARALQVLELDLDKGRDAPINGVHQRVSDSEPTHSLLHASGQDLVLALREREQQLMALDKIGQPFFGKSLCHRYWAEIGRSQFLAQNLDDRSVLAHRQVDQDPLGSEEILHSLLYPSRQQVHERRLPGLELGLNLLLHDCLLDCC